MSWVRQNWSIASATKPCDQAFRARWALMRAAAPTADPGWDPDEWTVFSVGLQTDAVLLEDGWRPAIVLPPAQLGLAAEPVRAWASARVVGGWNIRWNRHRPTVLSVVAGATYLFRTRASEPALDPLVHGFQLKLLWLAGYLPHLGSCAECGAEDPLVAFSAAQGGGVCRHCSAGAIPLSASGFLGAQLASPGTGFIQAHDHHVELARERAAHLDNQAFGAAGIQGVHHVGDRRPRGWGR